MTYQDKNRTLSRDGRQINKPRTKNILWKCRFLDESKTMDKTYTVKFG